MGHGRPITNTNAKYPNRITPAMLAALLEVEVQLSEHFLIWGGIQRIVFQSLITSVEKQIGFNSIDAHEDFFCFSPAGKIYLIGYDLYLSSGQNATLLEEQNKDQNQHCFDSISFKLLLRTSDAWYNILSSRQMSMICSLPIPFSPLKA